MRKIITISREFGSGGRELGKRIAEALHIAYYDKEIISAIAEKSALAENYIEQVVENRILTYYPITIASTFASIPYDSFQMINQNVYAAQAEIIKQMAQKSDCVIVGRCADHILREFSPLNLFVYADMPSKLARCMKKGHEMEGLSEKEIQRKIQSIDKARAQYYRFYTGQLWGDKLNYDLCLNTSRTDISVYANAVAKLLEG